MDSLIAAAAQALATGDALGALKRVALRNDAPALALRGVAMAPLGDLVRAKVLLRKAARAFGPKEPVARARCIVAEAEIALVSRDLSGPAKALDTAQAALERHGDRTNAAHAQHLKVRRLLLIGQLDDAERALAKFDAAPLPPALRAAHELVVAGIAMRRLRTKTARDALVEAERAARHAGIPALLAEVESTALVLNSPAARLIAPGDERLLRLEEVETLLASGALVVDACRHIVRDADTIVSLTTLPVLFALARALGEAWPRDVSGRHTPRPRLSGETRRPDRIARACASKSGVASLQSARALCLLRAATRARLLIAVPCAYWNAGADVTGATTRGFTLAPRRARKVVVLAPPVDDPHASVLSLSRRWQIVEDRDSGTLACAGEPAPGPCSAPSTSRWRAVEAGQPYGRQEERAAG